ncbi:MAG: nickel pincer cofactor biosynthesis protein LarB [Actinobacteria bacterium]|nr:MAG: nickel pincer cofactor biosynthesis protein LarB [Actinomycetota bacterium]
MDEIKEILKKVNNSELDCQEAKKLIERNYFADLGDAKIDHHRRIRCGFPEVIYCAGKTANQLKRIASEIYSSGVSVVGTRADSHAYKAIKEVLKNAIYYQEARIVCAENNPVRKTGLVCVVSAGTSDLSIAEEAAITAELSGSKVERIYDVGVAGIHRLLSYKNMLEKAKSVIAVAGMEGALPSVIGGLVAVPVIAVPTSVGYGASFEGVAPLLAMLNSCAAGVAVVNIDNGFGAGYLASMINRRK